MFSITVTKTLSRRIDVDGAHDFESAARWAADHWDGLDFGDGTAFWIEAASDDGRDAIVVQGAEGDGAPPAPTSPEGFVLTEGDDAVYRRVRRFYAELDVRHIASDMGAELDGAALDEAVDRYDRWQGSNDYWAPACADIIDDVMAGR